MMLRSMMQMYVKNSIEAVEFYQKAFDAELMNVHKNDDGSYMHAELNIYGQVVAISEVDDERVTGNTMQFCFHFGESEAGKVEKAYNILQEGAKVSFPLGPCFFSSLMADLVDKYGIHWCIFA